MMEKCGREMTRQRPKRCQAVEMPPAFIEERQAVDLLRMPNASEPLGSNFQ